MVAQVTSQVRRRVDCHSMCRENRRDRLLLRTQNLQAVQEREREEVLKCLTLEFQTQISKCAFSVKPILQLSACGKIFTLG